MEHSLIVKRPFMSGKRYLWQLHHFSDNAIDKLTLVCKITRKFPLSFGIQNFTWNAKYYFTVCQSMLVVVVVVVVVIFFVCMLALLLCAGQCITAIRVLQSQSLSAFSPVPGFYAQHLWHQATVSRVLFKIFISYNFFVFLIHCSCMNL